MTTSFYERTLDSFADDIITRVKPSGHGFYAVLDTGPKGHLSDPDFSSYGTSAERAIAVCAQKIRADHQGIGKYAPHGCLKADSYDFRWRLLKWWAEETTLISHMETP